MIAPRPWLGISDRDWFINSDTPHHLSSWDVFSGAILPSRIAAARSLMRHLAASIVARRRPMSLHARLCWLPVWLTGSGGPAVIGLHVYSLSATAPTSVA